jgi:hypothetical protein
MLYNSTEVAAALLWVYLDKFTEIVFRLHCLTMFFSLIPNLLPGKYQTFID